jgi:hypothetical protein
MGDEGERLGAAHASRSSIGVPPPKSPRRARWRERRRHALPGATRTFGRAGRLRTPGTPAAALCPGVARARARRQIPCAARARAAALLCRRRPAGTRAASACACAGSCRRPRGALCCCWLPLPVLHRRYPSLTLCHPHALSVRRSHLLRLSHLSVRLRRRSRRLTRASAAAARTLPPAPPSRRSP